MSAIQLSFLGYAARIGKPELLWVLPLVAMFVPLGIFLAHRRSAQLSRLAPERLWGRVVPGASPLRQGLRYSLASTAAMLLAVALAQPQCGSRKVAAKRYGIDIVIALDASRSMLARDIKPSRIERAKLELGSLLDRLKGDRVGIVVFAGDAFVQCPLTSDYAAAKLFLRAVDVNAMPVQGTDIGRALEVSREVLEAADVGAKARAIVLLSDGEDLEGEIDREVEKLSELGVKVMPVGVGSASGEPIPELDARGTFVGYKKDRAGNTVVTRLNEAGLQALADKTGGRYVHSANGGVGVGEIFEEIDRMQKAELDSRVTVLYDDQYQWAAFPALLLLLVSGAMRPAGRAR